MNLNAKVYVAGHRGLVGSALVRNLAAQGFRCIITRTHAALDLVDQKSVTEFFEQEKPEYVFLAAARVGGIMANSTYRGEFIYQNLMIQNNVIHNAMRHGVKRLVFLGSSCIYPKFAPQPMTEDCLLTGPLESTNSPYAVAKIAGIEMCDAYNRQYGTSFLPVMPTNLYGPGDNFDLTGSHVLPAMLRKFHLAKLASERNFEAIRQDEQRFGAIPEALKTAFGLTEAGGGHPVLTLWGTGSPMREFLHVDDMADACVSLMFRHDTTEIVNIGCGLEISIRELAEMVKDVVGYAGDIVWDTTKPDGTPRKLLSIDKLSAVGWKARIPLRDGIIETYKWYQAAAAKG